MVRSETPSPPLDNEKTPLLNAPRKPFKPRRGDDPYNRVNYFNKLTQQFPQVGLIMPEHILPAHLFLPFASKEKKSSSIQTIFSIWTTMMGTSLLAMPWGFSVAGWVAGLGLVFVMGLICYFTCSLILKHAEDYDDFNEVCKKYLGKSGYVLAAISSVTVLVGAVLVLDSIISSALFSLGRWYAFEFADNAEASWWTSNTTPFFIIPLLFPLLNIKSMQILVKLNSLGVVSLFYLLFFIFYSSIDGGLRNPLKDDSCKPFNSTAVFLSGVLLVSFFVHNLLIPIFRNQAKPENNTRDLRIAFLLVGVSYGAVGFIGYLGQKDDSNIAQNILNTFPIDDSMAVVARILLFFQLCLVFPIVAFIMRSQIFGVLYSKAFPSRFKVFALAVVVMILCTLSSIFFPDIGTLLRYVGAFSGLSYCFILPLGVNIQALKARGELTAFVLIRNWTLILFGFCIFISQFIF